MSNPDIATIHFLPMEERSMVLICEIMAVVGNLLP
jgi:hypothetical protein